MADIETFSDKPEIVFEATCVTCGDTERFEFEIDFEDHIGWDVYDRILKSNGWKSQESPQRDDLFTCPVCISKR
jgi:hypothetical protein